MKPRATLTAARGRPQSMSVALLTLALAACIDEGALRQPTLDILPGAPPGWMATSGTPAVGLSISEARTGANSAYLSGAFQSGFGVYRLFQNIRADNYRGLRVRLSGWVKPRNVGAVAISGLFMRVDGPGVALALDDMTRRPVFGLGDWRLVELVLDVPERAVGISLGAQFQATNTLLVDDLRFEVVSQSVPSTNMLTGTPSNGLDSIATVELYSRSPHVPVNLGFEGLLSLSGATSAWLARNSSVLGSTEPASAPDDLPPLISMVGDATLVGLGEGTYGTREFVQLKHRFLRSLVTTGFRTLALDAPLAEVADLDRYLQGEDGDLAALQSSLYAWHLDTREVADLFTWIRERNVSVAPAQRIRVVGLDVMHPGASMDSVVGFVHRVAPSFDADVAVWYQCLEPYRNRGATPGRPGTEYAAINANSRALCAEGINDALNLVTERGVGAADHAAAIGHARLVRQFESVITNTGASLATRARDSARADNALALIDGAPSGTRVVVWAHNDRVTRQAGAMGARLGVRLGTRYRPMAFTFGTGGFNALLQQGGTTGAVQSFTVQTVLQGSVEEAAMATGAALLLLDARKVNDLSADAEPLIGPVAMRTIGFGFDPIGERTSYPPRLFPADFDLLMFVRTGTPTTLLGALN